VADVVGRRRGAPRVSWWPRSTPAAKRARRGPPRVAADLRRPLLAGKVAHPAGECHDARPGVAALRVRPRRPPPPLLIGQPGDPATAGPGWSRPGRTRSSPINWPASRGGGQHRGRAGARRVDHPQYVRGHGERRRAGRARAPAPASRAADGHRHAAQHQGETRPPRRDDSGRCHPAGAGHPAISQPPPTTASCVHLSYEPAGRTGSGRPTGRSCRPGPVERRAHRSSARAGGSGVQGSAAAGGLVVRRGRRLVRLARPLVAGGSAWAALHLSTIVLLALLSQAEGGRAERREEAGSRVGSNAHVAGRHAG